MRIKKLIVLCIALLSTVLPLTASASVSQNMGEDDHNSMNMDDQHAEGDTGDAHAAKGDVNWFVIALLLGITGVLGYFASNTGKLRNINFLDYASIKNILKSRWYPLIFVLPTMLIFGIIVIQLFFGSSEASYNFGSVMVWIFLWPLLPILFLLFGRLWCSVCPLRSEER